MITVERNSTFADAFRAYRIMIDGSNVGVIRRGERVQVESVSPGKHSMRIAIDWTGSQELQFNYDGTDLNFECGSNLSGARIFLAIFYLFLPGQWCWLVQSERTPTPSDAG